MNRLFIHVSTYLFISLWLFAISFFDFRLNTDRREPNHRSAPATTVHTCQFLEEGAFLGAELLWNVDVDPDV